MFRMARRSAKRTGITTESLETMGEYGQEVAEGGQDGHPSSRRDCVLRTAQPGAQSRSGALQRLTDPVWPLGYGLGNDESEIMGHALFETPLPVRRGI